MHNQITECISTYALLPIPVAHSPIEYRLPELQQHGKHMEHQLFRVPELLDLILNFAEPVMQFDALCVSSLWRSSAISDIGAKKNLSGFRYIQNCQLIEYSQLIAPPLALLSGTT